MKYLSLYKTSSEHSADNSRLVPNISLITDEKKLILTNENNIDTTFTEVDIIESFDDIINRFPTGNSTSMPGIKIYMDNSEQSMAKNIKLCNRAIQWRSDYISYNGLSDTGQSIRINVDAVLIDNIIMDEYDMSYNYRISINNIRLTLYKNGTGGLDILSILLINGRVDLRPSISNRFPSPKERYMPVLDIKSNNIELYNNAQEWRKKYILRNELSDTGQPIRIYIDKLSINSIIMDEYNRYYYYYIDIYNDHIKLFDLDAVELLTISSDGLVNIKNL